MTFQQQVAKFVADSLNKDADRHEQAWSIKAALWAHDYDHLATDPATVDAVRTVLVEEYNFPA